MRNLFLDPHDRSRAAASPALLCLLLIITFALASYPYLDREFDYEEPILTIAGRTTWNTGYPRWVQGPFLDDMIQMQKPPIFIWTQALFIGLLGESELTARLPSLLGVMAAAALLGTMATRLGRETGHALLGPGVVLIFLLCPLTMQAAVHVQLDNGLLTCLLMLFIYAFAGLFLQHRGRRKQLFLVLLQISVFLSFGTKIETTAIVLFAMMLFLGLDAMLAHQNREVPCRQRLKRAISDSLILLVLFGTSTALLFGVVYLYCFHYDVPGRAWEAFSTIGRIVDTLIHRGETPAGSVSLTLTQRFFAHSMLSAKFLLWVTIPFAAAFAAALPAALFGRRTPAMVRLMACVAASICGVFIAGGYVGDGFPRYFMPALPAMALVIGWAVLSLAHRRAILVCMAGGAALVLIHWQIHGESTVWQLDRNATIVTNEGLRFLAMLITISFVAGLFQFTIPKATAGIVAVFVGAYLAWTPIQLTHDYRMAGGHGGFYGKGGYREAANWLNDQLPMDAHVLCPDTVGYYLKGGRQATEFYLVAPYPNRVPEFLRQVDLGELRLDAFVWFKDELERATTNGPWKEMIVPLLERPHDVHYIGDLGILTFHP